MATGVLIPIEEYLSTSYDPDREYVDGQLLERNVGEHDHSRLQFLIGGFFSSKEAEHKIRGFTEQRIRVFDDGVRRRYRIPDICVVQRPYIRERVLTHPPLLVIEILSPDDEPGDLLAKISDYLEFGVPHIWVVDPAGRKVFEASQAGLREAPERVLQLPEIGLSVDFNPLLAELDLE